MSIYLQLLALLKSDKRISKSEEHSFIFLCAFNFHTVWESTEINWPTRKTFKIWCRTSCLHNALSPFQMKDKLNLQLKDNMVRSCLLANTVLRDVISTPLLWRNFQTTKLFGSPVFYWILTHADDWFKSRNENFTNPFATFRRKKKRQTFFF